MFVARAAASSDACRMQGALRSPRALSIRLATAAALAAGMLALAGCISPPMDAAAARDPSSPPAPVGPSGRVSACERPEYHQLDFWIGDWDLVVRSPVPSGGGPHGAWTEERGENHVTAVLGGCGVAESFRSDGAPPAGRWAGLSLSRFVDAESRWRQAWMDDQGGFLTFAGGVEDEQVRLYGEPKSKDGVTTRMRMVFANVTPESLHWTWERTTDGGATWVPLLVIDYRRRAPR